MTTEEVAAIIGLTPNGVRYAARQMGIKTQIVGGHPIYVWTEKEIEILLNRNKEERRGRKKKTVDKK